MSAPDVSVEYDGAQASVRRVDHEDHSFTTYYFACKTCGNCSRHTTSRAIATELALDHVHQHSKEGEQ